MNISGLIITFNEEKNIGKCVKELFQVCNEVIVIDSLSTDKTIDIARKNGAKVIVQEFLGDGPQRAFGLQFCNNDWILNLDADEFLDTDALKFIYSKKYIEGNIDAWSFRVKNFLGNQLINFSGWYPDSKIRFFNKRTAHPSNAIVHQKIEAQFPKKVAVHILHYGWESLEQIITKKNQYSTWHALQLYDNGKNISIFKPFLNGSVAFIRCYFFKNGIFHGVDGFTFAAIQGFFSYIKYVKLLRLQKINKKK